MGNEYEALNQEAFNIVFHREAFLTYPVRKELVKAFSARGVIRHLMGHEEGEAGEILHKLHEGYIMATWPIVMGYNKDNKPFVVKDLTTFGFALNFITSATNPKNIINVHNIGTSLIAPYAFVKCFGEGLPATEFSYEMHVASLTTEDDQPVTMIQYTDSLNRRMRFVLELAGADGVEQMFRVQDKHLYDYYKKIIRRQTDEVKLGILQIYILLCLIQKDRENGFISD